ncbi:MAG: FlgD immunoglobulin-like domain containing protein [Candidatus Eisenbacteria bacterium]
MRRHRFLGQIAVRNALPGWLLPLLLVAPSSRAATDLGAAEPRLGAIPNGTVERFAADLASLPDEDLDAMRRDFELTGPLQRGGAQADNDACHYARGSTLIMHIFINSPIGDWDPTERSQASARATLAKQFYLENAPTTADLSFDNEDGTAFWYVSASYGSAIIEVDWDVMNAALQDIGITDNDGDGLLADDYSLALQNWNGGWDNVILVFQAGDLNGRAWASNATSACVLYVNSGWSVWAHEWGHLFGSCDEYVEAGTCGDGMNCGICQSTYLDEDYYNGNCDLACGSPDLCLMKLNDPVICPFTWQHWSWEDEDGNGQLDWVKRFDDSGTERNIMEMWPNGYFYHNTTTDAFAAHVVTPGWTVFGLRSPTGADYDLRLYGDNNETYQYASSAWSGQDVDFIVGDYHLNRTGVEVLQVERYSGSSANYDIVWEGAGESLYPDGVVRSQNWIAENVVRAYDVPLYAGEQVVFELDVTAGSLDPGMALFSSAGTTYFSGRSGALWSRDNLGAGGTELFTFDVPATDVYGLIVWTNAAAAGTFTVKIGPTQNTIAEETPVSSGFPLKLYNYDPAVPFWAVVGSRPASGGNISLRLCDDSQYTISEAFSDAPGDKLELVAVNYADHAINRDYLRIAYDSVTTYRTEWEQSPDLSGGMIVGTWSSEHVAKVWDAYLEAGQQYYFREYHTLFPIPHLNTGLYLFGPGGDPTQAKSAAVASSDLYDAFQGERFLYTPTTTGFHGLTLVMNNEGSDGYSIMWGPRLDLVDNQKKSSGNEVAYGTTPVIASDWVVWGARPTPGDQVSAWNFGPDPDYVSYDVASTNVQGVNVLVCDRNHVPGVEAIYTRYQRTAGSGPIDYEYEGGAGENVPYTAGGLQVMDLTWETDDVVEGYDLLLPGSRTNPAYVEIRAVPTDGNLDLGMALFSSSNGEYYQGLGDAVAVANQQGPGGSETLIYQTELNDVFGLVIWNANQGGGSYQLQILGSPVVEVDEGASAPAALSLQAGPNPVQDAARLTFALPTETSVELGVFDVKGRRVRTLAEGSFAAGVHEMQWDGRDEDGVRAGAGVYLVRLVAGNETRTTKLVRSGS